MSDLLAKLEELASLPPGLHWFCPIFDDFSEEGEEGTAGSESHLNSVNVRVKDVDYRRRLVIESLHLFLYDGEDAAPHQRFLMHQIDAQLGKCDACITEYHKGKRQMLDSLRHEYEEDEVEVVVRLLDKQDFARIERGLDRATEALEAAEPAQRGVKALEVSSQFALFEALSCDAFLKNSELVRAHLDRPMVLVQTNRRLQAPRYVPATTYFLFDPEPSRCAWAMETWSKYQIKMSKDDFDFAVHEPLAMHMAIIRETITDASVLQRFWCGMQLVVEKLDKDLVTHSLLALEVDVCRLALDHLQVASPALRFLLRTIQVLLEIAPQNFWDSMGPIPPTTVIEQIFNNAHYDRFMIEAQDHDESITSPLKDLLTWIKPFMASLQPSHQVQACRSLAFQLLDRLQEKRFAACARLACKESGFFVLDWALSSCNKTTASLSQVGRMVAAECLEVIGTYIQHVMAVFTSSERDPSRERLEALALDTVKGALALECKSIRTDQDTLKLKKELPSGFCSYTPSIWDAVVQRMTRNNLTLAKAALIGVGNLTGLEKFKTSGDDEHCEEKCKFNGTLGHLTHLVCHIMERISEFNPSDLDTLFEQSETATALVASLFSPDASTYDAGVNLIKAISLEVARREAVGHLLKSFFDTTLNSFSWAIRRIADNKTFASCPRMLKTLEDALDILSNSQNGLLRTRPLASVAESKAVQRFWENQWQALGVTYEMTEEWGRLKVSDNDTLREFCRDTMQFSDRLFDQYSVFASALAALREVKSEDGQQDIEQGFGDHELLSNPAKTMHSMVKWLRLRDPYLASTSASLTQKILDRLSDTGMKLAREPVNILEHVIRGTPKGRTHLSEHEKAEIARSLERNLGRPIMPLDTETEKSDSSRATSVAREVVASRKKEAVIDFEKWSSKARQTTDSTSADEDRISVSDPRTGELKGLQAFRASGLGRSHRESISSKTAIPAGKITKQDSQREAAQARFRENREKEKAAKKKRDAEALARIKGKSTNTSESRKHVGLGVEGKDHAPSGPSMMVSSSESDSEGGDDDELFGPAPRVSDAVRDYQMSRLKAKQHHGPIKKTKQVRSAKDMRARLAPDLAALHQTILGWEYFHAGEFPPGTSRKDYSQVPNRLRTPLDYHHVFEPLLILEAWNGFLKSREESNMRNFEIKVASRMTVDTFIEVSTSMPLAEGQELGLGEADIILLSKGKAPAVDTQQPHCLARVHRITRKKAAMEISYRIGPGNPLLSTLLPNATIYGARILSITPLEREYGALLGLKYFDLCSEVIEAKPSPLLHYSSQQLSPLVANYKVNEAQARAIRSAIDNDAFTLVQGPPGSGKTKTIVAIVGALLTESLNDKGMAIARPGGAEPASRQSTAGNKKLLVCAPSNAAVDELVMRFKEGVKTVHGKDHKISIVRLGRSDAINSSVKDITLEELVNAKLNLASGKTTKAGEDINQLMMAHKATCDEINALRSRLDEMKAQGKSATPDQERNFEVLKRKRQQLSNNIDHARDNSNVATRDIEIHRRQIQQSILDGAHIICATLSGSGHDMFQNLNIEFETVVIDEAAQSIELSALIPLKYGCSKCILVGDPKQLPPTVLSREAARFQYEQSLFVRMQANHPADVHLLDTQYRMHPEISRFPSKAFYEGKLVDGPDMLSIRTRTWHKSDLLAPYRFFDVKGTQQSAPRGHSLINLAEIEVALRLYERLTSDCRGYEFQNKIGIITPYKSQLRELKARFAQDYGRTILEKVEFNTTDAFQGRESEVIIFSCVRASINKSIGFLDDIRRMNVGITRAKCSLWVLGNSQSLINGEFWAKLIRDAKERNCYTDGNLVERLQRPLQELAFTAKRPSVSGSHDAETSDVEMADTQSNGKITSDSSRTSSVSQPQRVPYTPAGGQNGLNMLANCQKCGSAAHMTHLCDNSFAAMTTQAKCTRCGNSDHPADKCTTERCLECGEFGHTAKLCFSTGRSRASKFQLTKDELRHQRYVQQAPLVKAQKQLGDHDKPVPAVRVTARTPPPEEQTSKLEGKRKRQPSPPASLSQRPKDSSNTPLNAPRGPSSNKSSTSRDMASSRFPHEAQKVEHFKPVTATPEQVEKKLSVNRPGLPGNVRPPAKKRKEVDPFIRPKRK